MRGVRQKSSLSLTGCRFFTGEKKMKQRVIDNIRREHPWTFGLDLKLKSKVLKERNRLMKELLSQYFDKLLTHLLRKTMFMRIYWTLIPSLKKKLTHEELVGNT
jgi:hypothetical protein